MVWRSVISCLTCTGPFRERALKLVALLRKETCNLRHPMHLRRSVASERGVGAGVCVCVCVCTRACTHTHTHAHTLAYAHAYADTQTHAYAHHTAHHIAYHLHTHHLHTHERTNAHTHARTHAHTCAHTHHTHTRQLPYLRRLSRRLSRSVCPLPPSLLLSSSSAKI